MKQTLSFTLIFFFLFIQENTFGQKKLLQINSTDSIENKILNNIIYKRTHPNLKSINITIDSVTNTLKQKGYFFAKPTTNNIHPDSIQLYTYILGKKTNFIKLNKETILKTEKLPKYLDSISNSLNNKGFAFSEVQLKNIYINKDTLFATLNTHKTEKRRIDKILIKGYDDFPKSFLRHYLKLKNKTTFNKKNINKLSNQINSLAFISETKKPEILFSKDSTILYLNIKKKKQNSFDGLINFSSKENGKGILFNGHLKLDLLNILNTGEEFNLEWKANGEERQSFNINTRIPYIFNSPITATLGFNIFKQDSTFLNSTFKSEIDYTINYKSKIGLTFTSEESNNTLNTPNNSIMDYKKNMFGINYEYKIKSTDLFTQNKLLIRLHPSFGKRQSNNNTNNQLKFESEISYLFNINKKHQVHLRNHSGYINSRKLFLNELFRLGGNNSIRGIIEEGLLLNKFSYFNIDYIYQLSKSIILHSITDLEIINNKNTTTLGLGIKLSTNQNLFEIYIANSNIQNFSFNNSQLSLKYITFF